MLFGNHGKSITVRSKALKLFIKGIPNDGKGQYRIYQEPVKMENLTDGKQAIGISNQTFTVIPDQACQL